MNDRTSRAALHVLFVSLFVCLGSSTSRVAHAEPRPAPDFEAKPVEKAYAAPLSQTTQPSYVPQSVALSGPATLAWHDERAVPAGYTPVERTRQGAIIAGASVFGSLYILSLMGAANGGDLTTLAIPGIGPFLQMANWKGSAKVIFAIDGLAQSGGLALLVWGIASPKTVLVRNDLAALKPRVRPVPLVAANTAGVGLAGSF